MRLQRIPPTERRGRVHTSTVTIAVLDPNVKVNDALMKRSDDDFRVEFYSGTGKGGQHRNKHQNCVRMTHIPTGILQTANGRERSSNLRDAKTALLEILDRKVEEERGGVQAVTRKDQVGSGERGDKIRTLRFQDDQIVDHRSGKKITATEFMKGYMEKLW